MANFDLVIRGGTVFDGTGAVPTTADVGVRDGKVAAIAQGLPEGVRTVDARGQWVMPGLIDVHTHYDAEVLLSSGPPARLASRCSGLSAADRPTVCSLSSP